MNETMLLPAAFVAGFFGSGHCLAMCGPVILLLEHQNPAGPGTFVRRLCYNAGRAGFYVLLGVIAGASGALLVDGLQQGLGVLRTLAALLLVLLGFNLAFGWRALAILERAGGVIWKNMSPLARHILPISSPATALAAGFLWGALPCGLVYSAVALAATSGNAVAGGSVMLAFWAGTVPTLMLAATSAHGLKRWKERRSLRLAAGLLLIVMGIAALALPMLRDQAGVPHHASQEF